MLKLYNTLSKKKEEFKPLQEVVSLYACGPTVYDYAHIGNLRAYTAEDILKRVLYYNNYQVKHVMCITDVGHLTSDEDTGDDKVQKKAREKKMTAYDVAEFYTKAFLKDIDNLNIIRPDILVKATETIEEQIDLVKKMEEKGYTYRAEDGIYFDTSKLESYGQMAGLDNVCLKPGARVDIKDKKNPTDFALWKFSAPEEKRDMEWESPWGVGFPGWHTECIAMAEMHLGIPFDIHCGGVDHICVHHTNEIAQSEVIFNNNPSRFWVHVEFLTLKGGKMSKSKGGTTTLPGLIEKGYHPSSFRYLMLNGHYRAKLDFSEEAIGNAQNAYQKLKNNVCAIKTEEVVDITASPYRKEFQEAVNNDLNTPEALAVLWRVVRDKELENSEKYALVSDFNRVLGLDLEEDEVCPEACQLAQQREKARGEKDFAKADELRQKIEDKGYVVEDKKEGYKLKKK